MMTDEELELYLAAFQKRMDEVTDKYITMIGEHVADIGQLTASDLHRIKEMRRMGKNLDEIERDVARVTRLNVQDARKLIEKTAIDLYGDYTTYGIAALSGNAAVKSVIEATAKQTASAMANLSNTTVASEKYRECVDKAITTVQSGVTDYQSAMRSTIKDMSHDGLRIQYESGLRRRLDTAVRQNILDGTKQINQKIARIVGQQFGADGVEISAHTDCAPDHLPYQGKQMSIKQYDELQATLKRPFGEWNCRHFAFPIILGVSKPAYSQRELAGLRAQSTEQITIDGVTKTRYKWTQKQRELETEVRYAKNEANACKASGDDVGRRNAQARMNDIDRLYAKVSDEAGIPTRRERMQVAGFRRVKEFNELPDTVRYKGAMFANERAFDKHIEKHLNKYGDITPEEYVARAEKLLRSPVSDDILRCVRADGSVSKYCVSTNEFVAGTVDGKIRTAFKPDNGIIYWKEELDRNGEKD